MRTNMDNIIKEVYAIFGDNLPSRSLYSANTEKPFPVLNITKAFKSWNKFKEAYTIYAMEQRNKQVTKSVVTKKKAKKDESSK